MLTAAHPGGSEAVAELDAAHGRDREQGVRDEGLGRVEEGLAEARRESADADLHESADRVAVGLGGRCRRSHVGAAARLDDARVEGDGSTRDSRVWDCRGAAGSGRGGGNGRMRARSGCGQRLGEHALGDRAGGDEARGDAAREVARAAGIGKAAELVARGEVRVARPRDCLKAS